jgi:tetratricopeptide (TPR) repeat protein
MARPVEERDPRRAPRGPEPPARPPPAEPPLEAPKPVDPPDSPSGSGDRVDPVRASKAAKLFEQALADKTAGNLVSARMNMKLALTFDPTNELYARAFEEIAANPEAAPKASSPGRTRARELYDAATEAENEGDYDEAIHLLEKAIGVSKQAAFHNRLGVILAMKKQEFERAQTLIEKAIELSPGNPTYERNLQKILSMAATHGMRKQKKAKRGGLLGLFGRRR